MMFALSDINATFDSPPVPTDGAVRRRLSGVNCAILISTELGVDFVVKEC